MVIVGDVGLNVNRATLYRKEIDLLHEHVVRPGPLRPRATKRTASTIRTTYVRWTLNRNMQAYLELLASGAHSRRAADRPRGAGGRSAPQLYEELAKSGGAAAARRALEYPDETRLCPSAASAGRDPAAGRRGRPPRASLKYALVGAGAFGTACWCRRWRRRTTASSSAASCSRNAIEAGNFARANQVEVLATDLETVLDDPAHSTWS